MGKPAWASAERVGAIGPGALSAHDVRAADPRGICGALSTCGFQRLDEKYAGDFDLSIQSTASRCVEVCG
jgi:hypothetical protein